MIISESFKVSGESVTSENKISRYEQKINRKKCCLRMRTGRVRYVTASWNSRRCEIYRNIVASNEMPRETLSSLAASNWLIHNNKHLIAGRNQMENDQKNFLMNSHMCHPSFSSQTQSTTLPRLFCCEIRRVTHDVVRCTQTRAKRRESWAAELSPNLSPLNI